MSRAAKVKAAAQSVLHVLWLGWIRHAFPMLHLDGGEAKRTLEAVRQELRDFDHDGSGDVIEMAGVAVTAFGFAQHAAESRAEQAAQARAEAMEQEERADRAEELLVEVRSTLHAVPASAVTTGDVVDAIELIDNHMNEREAK